ncbi:uncharacterized protein LOC111133505 [Crassostrea virginica]
MTFSLASLCAFGSLSTIPSFLYSHKMNMLQRIFILVFLLEFSFAQLGGNQNGINNNDGLNGFNNNRQNWLNNNGIDNNFINGMNWLDSNGLNGINWFNNNEMNWNNANAINNWSNRLNNNQNWMSVDGLNRLNGNNRNWAGMMNNVNGWNGRSGFGGGSTSAIMGRRRMYG